MVTATLLENDMIKRILLSGLLLFLPLTATAELYVTIVQGLDGEVEYGEQFTMQTGQLVSAATSITGKQRVTLLAGADSTREKVLAHFDGLAKTLKAEDRFAVFMIGHGSYDGVEYKFNIAGPDLTDSDLLNIFQAQPAKLQILVNTSSSSGSLQDILKADNRAVITATRNGEERLATRFGTYFANALEDSAADTNKNDAVSLQEAFEYAERMVKDYFETQSQLATEHPVMAEKQAAQFVLARTSARPTQDATPELVALVKQREELDINIEQLQLRKNELAPDEYMNQLQQLMIELSVVQDRIDQQEKAGSE